MDTAVAATHKDKVGTGKWGEGGGHCECEAGKRTTGRDHRTFHSNGRTTVAAAAAVPWLILPCCCWRPVPCLGKHDQSCPPGQWLSKISTAIERGKWFSFGLDGQVMGGGKGKWGRFSLQANQRPEAKQQLAKGSTHQRPEPARTSCFSLPSLPSLLSHSLRNHRMAAGR